jgi:thiol-disulfide isomerase/thioredoxin
VIDEIAPEARGTLLLAFVATLIRAATAVAALLWFDLSPDAAELQRWTSDEPPHFILPDTGRASVALAAGRGSVTIVHFFATWCESCRQELPALNRLSERSGGTVMILAISVAEPDVRVERFLQSMPLIFPVLLDRDRTTTKSWNVSTLPTSVVLDSELKASLLVEGDCAWDTIDLGKLTGEVSSVKHVRHSKQD